MISLRGPSTFQWSTSEQIYPFEKDTDGNILYCKQVNMGNLVNNGSRTVAHGISGLVMSKVFKVMALAQNPTTNFGGPSLILLDHADGQAPAYGIYCVMDPTNISIGTATTDGRWSSFIATVKIIYAK